MWKGKEEWDKCTECDELQVRTERIYHREKKQRSSKLYQMWQEMAAEECCAAKGKNGRR